MARVTSVRKDYFIRQRHLHDRYLISTADIFVGSREKTISRNTVRNRLRDRRTSCRRPYRGPILTRRHRLERQQWARNNRVCNWRNVVFSDESRFNIFSADSRIRICRRRKQIIASSPDCNQFNICGTYWVAGYVNVKVSPRNVRELAVALREEWARISRYLLRNP